MMFIMRSQAISFNKKQWQCVLTLHEEELLDTAFAAPFSKLAVAATAAARA